MPVWTLYGNQPRNRDHSVATDKEDDDSQPGVLGLPRYQPINAMIIAAPVRMCLPSWRTLASTE